jgi:phosphoglycerate transport regulatory protein PgtC
MRRKAQRLPTPSRRSVLLGALAASAAFARPAGAQTATLQVVTSFPEELTIRYEEEFEKLHPDAHVQFVWKQTRDALDYLGKPDQSGADVYWAPSPNNFFVLRERSAFRKITVDRAALPGKLQDLQLSDPDGYFEAYDVAGYGIVTNPALLKQRGLETPRSWHDLASPAYSGQIVMPNAAKVGFSPALYDIVLQSEGWDKGWALLSEIAANAQLLDAGHLPTRDVTDGRAALGLSIDFFASQARANGLAADFVYPAKTAFLPAHVAITASTKRPDLAKAFVDFLLSNPGQRLMIESGSSRHPARPDAYADKPAALVDPFALPKGAIAAYDLDIGRRRPGLVVSLFDILITERHEKTAALWGELHAAELKHAGGATPPALAEARRLAGFVPISARDAANPSFLESYAARDKIDPAVTQKWRSEVDAAHAKAKELLAGAAL